MYIILGASGQVGSAVVSGLAGGGARVKAVIHNADKAGKFNAGNISVGVADGHDLASLAAAFEGGETLFAITPETGKSKDLIKETAELLSNYRKAAEGAGIKKVVGLSSMGAHLGKGTGNLEMSYMLEHAFDGLPVKQTFIRPAYYYSNWLMGIDEVKATGVLKTFYPVDLAIPMVSPQEVAQLAVKLLLNDEHQDKKYICELEGPASYNSNDVAGALSSALGKTIKAEQIPPGQWPATLKKMGFTDDGADNFIKMTDTVIKGSAKGEGHGRALFTGETTLEEFIKAAVKD